MPKITKSLVLLSALCLSGLGICQETTTSGGAIPPLVHPKFDNPAKINLGRHLYHDANLSQDLSLSCSSCHSLQKGGADGLPKFIGMHKRVGSVNTPTVFNASFNFRQFWDGRAKNLEEAIDDHVKDELIFANNWETIVKRLNEEVNIASDFKHVYNEKINADHIKDALVAYLDTLLTPDSPFDKFLKGNKNALNEDEKKGYQLFLHYGCITCHEGPNMGGNLYQKMGIYKNYFSDRHLITEADLGRFNVTRQESDKFVFKVPTLRNIALTGPYFHDGSVNTLEEVVEIMGVYEVGQVIPPFEVPYIVKFLKTLTGVIPIDDTTIQKKSDSQ